MGICKNFLGGDKKADGFSHFLPGWAGVLLGVMPRLLITGKRGEITLGLIAFWGGRQLCRNRLSGIGLVDKLLILGHGNRGYGQNQTITGKDSATTQCQVLLGGVGRPKLFSPGVPGRKSPAQRRRSSQRNKIQHAQPTGFIKTMQPLNVDDH